MLLVLFRSRGLGRNNGSSQGISFPYAKALLLFILFLTGMPFLEGPVSAQLSQSGISDIKVEGNQHIELQAILGKLSIKTR